MSPSRGSVCLPRSFRPLVPRKRESTASTSSTACASVRLTSGQATGAATRTCSSLRFTSIGWKRPEETKMTLDPHDRTYSHDHDHPHGHNHSHDPIEVTQGAGEYEIMVHAIKE